MIYSGKLIRRIHKDGKPTRKRETLWFASIDRETWINTDHPIEAGHGADLREIFSKPPENRGTITFGIRWLKQWGESLEISEIPETAGDLDEFTRAYIECLLWSSMDNSDENTGDRPLDESVTIDDVLANADARKRVLEDCAAFQEKAGDLIDEMGASQAGHDFWLTRTGHGAGFWDGDWPVNGDALTKLSKDFGEDYETPTLFESEREDSES